MLASLAQAARGEPVHVEYRLGTPDRPVWLSFDYIPVRDAAGAVIGTCITNLDIIDQREALAALTRSEERFRALVAGTSDTIALLDGDMSLRYASPAWERTLGYSVAAWLGRNPFELIHPDDLEEAQRGMDALLRGEPEPQHVTLRLRHHNASWVWCEIVGADLRGHPAVEGIVLTIRDVTERKRLTTQLLQAQRMDSIGRLAGGIAHDFNNLLTALTGYIELALDSLPANSPIRDDIVEAQRAAERGSGLTRQLLAFARRQTIAPEPCALNELIADMERLLRRLIGEDITLATHLAPNVGVVVADPSQLEQVLVNLAVNARDAMPAGGSLSVERARVHFEGTALRPPALHPGAYVRITVSDTGVGMSEQVREHIFEPFFTTKGTKGGTGLGLATCYGIVAQHGGAIEVASQPGAGTTFQIYLPQAASVSPASPSSPPTHPGCDGSETVLVVEDDPAIRTLAARVLREHGYTVHEAQDGLEALETLTGGVTVQLVLSDVVMPRLGGRELIARLRAEWPTLPVVYMSGYSDDTGLAEALRDGRGQFIQKPFSAAVLLRVVREVLDLARPTQPQ